MSQEEFADLVTKRNPMRHVARQVFGGWFIALGSFFSYQTIHELFSERAHLLHGVGLLLTLSAIAFGVLGLIQTSKDHVVVQLDVHASTTLLKQRINSFCREHAMKVKAVDPTTDHAIGTGFDRTEMLTWTTDGRILYSIRSAQSARIDWPIFKLSRLRKAFAMDLSEIVTSN